MHVHPNLAVLLLAHVRHMVIHLSLSCHPSFSFGTSLFIQLIAQLCTWHIEVVVEMGDAK